MKRPYLCWSLGLLIGPAIAGAGKTVQPPPVYMAPAPPAPTPAAPKRVSEAAPSTSPSASAQPAAPSPTAAPPATPAAPPLGGAKRSAAELEKLAQPIALHPDPLIAVLLPASVYPVEIVQAARFVKDTNNIPKVDEQPWDENVKAVAKFPQLIAQMDADLNWTVQLGQAFLDQRKELMDTIQALRAKAQKAGTLQNTEQQIVVVTNEVVQKTIEQQVVVVTNTVVQIQPSNPQVVYVPSYPPTVYYPPPAYVYNPVAPLVTFGVGMAWGAILANNCNWHHGDVDVDIDRNVNRNVNRDTDRTTPRSGNRASTTGQKGWQPDQSRMRSSGAAGASAGTREARGWGSGGGGARASTQPAGGARPSTGNVGARPSTGNVGARPSTGSAGARPSTGSPSASRPSASPSVSRSSPSPSASRSTPSPSVNRSSGGSAFGGMSSGSSSRSYSNRGSASRGGGGGRGGGGRR